jgi:hypothetical protein
MKGIYDKYIVQKKDKETKTEADYFVLRLDSDENARQAMLFYAQLIENTNPILAKDIRKKVGKYDGDCSLHVPVIYNTKQEEFVVASEIQYDTYGNIAKVIGIDEDGEPIEHIKHNIDINNGDWY